MLTYAQNFEDVMLARAFEGRDDGFYIDIGASDPEYLSVSKHFYDRGWRGVNVEPIPRCHERFVAARPRDINLNVAVGAARGERAFFECTDFDALSTFDPAQADFLRAQGHSIVSYKVPTITCDDVFERAGAVEVDFLKIDVEGAEHEVIASLDLSRHRPKIILLEAMAPGREFPGWYELGSVENWSSWEPRILAGGYRFAHFDGVSRFYVREDVAHLAKVFRLPVGMFDDVHFPEEIRLKAREAELLNHVSGVEQHVHSLERHIAEESGLRAAAEAATTAIHQAAAVEQARLNAQLAERDARLAEREARVAELDARVAELAATVASLEASLAETRGKLKALEDMTLWQRVKHTAFYAKVKVRDAIFGGIWTFAAGRGAPPLPAITLVTPVLNGAAHIAETIESVLRQEYPSLEYVVVDGGSTDGTLDIVREYAARTDLPQRIARVVSEPDRGMYDAVGKGLAGASGEVLGYLNADDLLEAGGLLAVGRAFAAKPKLNAVFHEDAVLVNGWKYPNVRQPRRVTVHDLLRGHILFQDGVFFRRHLYEAAGGARADLRLAGDYDLWLRMCALARFERRDNHVSCFRVRSGQLSADMDKYHAEMARAKADFLRGKGLLVRLRWALVGLASRAGEALARTGDRLFFPLDFGNMPPPLAIAPAAPGAAAPRSPVDGAYAERLLFSTVDTRFGDRELNYLYLDTRHGIAVTYPPVEPQKLDALYRRNYSAPPTALVYPEGVSPFRHFDRRRLWHKLLFRFPVEWFHKYVTLPSWQDNTLDELSTVLREAGIDAKRPLRVLDTGCFEGILLDRIRTETPWQAFGLEPNAHAVGVARAKGHEVWQAHAENATEVVPGDRQFDVVFMGQSIEHVDDPVRVLRRLRLLLAPGGVLVVSTPNLDSHQVTWFGPTWAHWHPPYHRYIFSKRGLHALAGQAGLHVRRFRTFSHPYWTAMSLAQHMLGLDAVVSHAVEFDMGTRIAAQRMDYWAKWWWNRRDRGDYAFMVMGEDERA